MKYLLLLTMVVSLNSWSEVDCIKGFDEKSAKKVYSGEKFSILLTKDDSKNIYDQIKIYAKHKSGCITDIGSRFDDEIIKVAKWSDNKYVFKNYLGGNSINAENNKQLLLVGEKMVTSAGYYSCVFDVDNDGIDDFCKYDEIISEDGPIVDRRVVKVKLKLVNGKLMD